MSEEQMEICQRELGRLSREALAIIAKAGFRGGIVRLSQEKWDELDELESRATFLWGKINETNFKTQ